MSALNSIGIFIAFSGETGKVLHHSSSLPGIIDPQVIVESPGKYILSFIVEQRLAPEAIDNACVLIQAQASSDSGTLDANVENSAFEYNPATGSKLTLEIQVSEIVSPSSKALKFVNSPKVSISINVDTLNR